MSALESSGEEILRKKWKPNPTMAQVFEAVLRHFFAGRPDTAILLVKELGSYGDNNFWITVNGITYLVKVHSGVKSKDMIQHLQLGGAPGGSGDYRKSAIHLQHSIMTHLDACGITTDFDSRG